MQAQNEQGRDVREPHARQGFFLGQGTATIRDKSQRQKANEQQKGGAHRRENKERDALENILTVNLPELRTMGDLFDGQFLKNVVQRLARSAFRGCKLDGVAQQPRGEAPILKVGGRDPGVRQKRGIRRMTLKQDPQIVEGAAVIAVVKRGQRGRHRHFDFRRGLLRHDRRRKQQPRDEGQYDLFWNAEGHALMSVQHFRPNCQFLSSSRVGAKLGVSQERCRFMAQKTSLIGHDIANSSLIEQHIQALVKEVGRLEEPLTEVRGALPEFADSGKKEFDRAGAVRGRPLHYSYVGTGAGRGVFVELEDGSVKIDMINGIGIHLMGHAHPRVLAAGLRGSLSDIVNQGNLQPNKEYTRMMEKLVSLAGRKSRLKYAWLSTCGTMANESALKISRQKKTPARMMLSFQNAFAGRSTMMAELTDNPAYRVGLPEYNEVLRLPFYDKRDARSSEKTLSILKEHVAKHENNISVFAFEPMLGEGGYRPAPREFFVPLLEFCREKKIPVWADEVQTFTRTGEFFAFETLGIGEYIDLCTVAKTAQIGATLYTEEMNPAPGLIAGTFSGSTAALSAGLEILNILDEGGYTGPHGRIAQIHQRFIGMLNRLNETTCKGQLVDAEGMGLMIAVTPMDGKKETVDKLLRKMFALGLIAFPCGKDPVRIRFLVPAITQDHEIDMVGRIIERAITEGV